ncbi:MAG: glycosyl hydrolase family 18 protein, partial [Bacteroidota bacterium]
SGQKEINLSNRQESCMMSKVCIRPSTLLPLRFCLGLFLCSILLQLPVSTVFAQSEWSIHEEHATRFQQLGFQTEAEWDVYNGYSPESDLGHSRNASGCTLNKQVYGWHPYWMGSAYNSYDFDLLSTFSYFSYEVNPATGNYNTVHSWKTTNSVNIAQAAGCKVELCATLFGGTNNTTFLTNPTAQQTFIDSMIAMVQYRNADGVNIDFEGIPGAQRNNFTTFIQNLSGQLKTAVPGATLTMAIFAVDWNNVFDITNLDPVVDGFIIMGYGYHYSGSATAGPTAPLYSGSIWWPYDLTRSVLYYLGEGVTADKLLIGLPYYGNEYNTTSNAVPGSSTGFQAARTYSYIRNNYTGVQPRIWDPHSLTPAFIFQSGGQWRQAWVDDEVSLAEKFDLAHHKNIGGIGIWALGYDGGYPDLWDLLEEKFSDCGPAVCTDTLYDTGGPLGNYRNNENYAFTITSPAGQNVRAEFIAFDLEANFDYVYVHDGSSTAAPLIGQYSGTTAPGPFTSTGDALTFRFTTDGATIASGYRLKWDCEGPSTYAGKETV